MGTWRYLRNLTLTLLTAVLMAAPLAACSGDDDGFRCPAPITSPVDGQKYTPWVENPHETDGCPYAPAAFAMPTDRPVQSPGMSSTDFLLLMMLFDNHTTYGPSFYDRPGYYNSRIAPAWGRYPGTYSAGPGGRVTVHHTTINNYGDTTRKFETANAATIKANSGKQQAYVDAKGKTYKGTQVPDKAFSGGNSGRSLTTPSTGTVKTTTAPGPRTGNSSSTGKSGYGSSTGGKSSTSSGRSSSSGPSRSSGGGRK